MSEAEETSAAALTAASAAVLEDLEQQYITVCADRERLHKDLQAARVEISNCHDKLRNWETSQRNQQELQNQLEVANSQIASLTEQQQNLQERLDRNLTEADALRDEIRCVHRSSNRKQYLIIITTHCLL
jgi:predicted  nucleic acid-binding Zn-ribbon protein